MGLNVDSQGVIPDSQPDIPEKLNNPANWMTWFRALSAIPICCMAAKGHNMAGPAVIIAAASDAEGKVARWGAHHGKGWLTEFGRKFDPIADKILTVSVAAGTLMGGLGNTGETALTGGILAEQIAVAGIAMVAEKRHPGELHVSKIGKAGICLVFGYLAGINMLNLNLIEQNAGVHNLTSGITTSLGIGSLGVVGLASKGYIKEAFNFGHKHQADTSDIPIPVSDIDSQ